MVLGFQAETHGVGGSEHSSIQACRISGWQHQGVKWWLTSEQVAGQRGMHFAPKMFCTMTFFQLAGIIPKKLITEMASSLQSCYKIKQLGTTQVSMAH